MSDLARRPVVIVLALLERDGRYLVRERAPGRHLAGLWEFPGGKLEYGESPEDAVRRECVEEVGAAPTEARLLGVVSHVYADDGVHVVLLAYHGLWPDGEEPMGDVRWVTREEAAALPMPAANARVLALLDSA